MATLKSRLCFGRLTIYKGENQFPKAIQQLHTKKISIVALTGMPIEVNDDRKVISSC